MAGILRLFTYGAFRKLATSDVEHLETEIITKDRGIFRIFFFCVVTSAIVVDASEVRNLRGVRITILADAKKNCTIRE